MDLQPERLFQLLADDTRLRSVVLLHREGELCVCELTHALGVIQPKVSRHLAALKEAGLVRDRRQAQWVYYQLHPELPEWARTIISAVADGNAQFEPFTNDRAALAHMPNRPGARHCA
ncbi:MAG: metalloregulator ArsR/SmtB family transcription factor [Acidiferrobacterales bacterium]